MKVPAIAYVAALFSDVHDVTRSHKEDEAEAAAALIGTGSADILIISAHKRCAEPQDPGKRYRNVSPFVMIEKNAENLVLLIVQNVECDSDSRGNPDASRPITELPDEQHLLFLFRFLK